jgi:hypothetical protein
MRNSAACTPVPCSSVLITRKAPRSHQTYSFRPVPFGAISKHLAPLRRPSQYVAEPMKLTHDAASAGNVPFVPQTLQWGVWQPVWQGFCIAPRLARYTSVGPRSLRVTSGRAPGHGRARLGESLATCTRKREYRFGHQSEQYAGRLSWRGHPAPLEFALY